MAQKPPPEETLQDVTRELMAATKAYRDGIRKINQKISDTLTPFKERLDAEGDSVKLNPGEEMLIHFISSVVDIIGDTVEQVEKAQNERS